jgi:hypothetical protein
MSNGSAGEVGEDLLDDVVAVLGFGLDQLKRGAGVNTAW